MTCLREHRAGLCRKQPSLHALRTTTGIQPETAHEGLSGGGGGGPGTVRRGMESALSAMRTLNRNRQLLWFTSLAGLVLAGTLIGRSALPFIDWPLRPYISEWMVLNWFVEFATVFCLVFLLTGLVLALSPEKDGSVSFFDGLAGAKRYVKAIFSWSVILATAGMLLFLVFQNFLYSPGWLPRELLFLDIFRETNLLSTLSQFPFNFAFEPKTLTDIPGYEGRSLLLWIYPFNFMDALVFAGINLLLFVLTPFVVPLVVLGNRSLREAVAGSFALMRTAWKEVASCASILGVIFIGAFLSHLLVQAAHGSPVVTGPGDAWTALGLLYDLVLAGVAFVMATVGGIAALDLYRSSQGGGMPGSPGTA